MRCAPLAVAALVLASTPLPAVGQSDMDVVRACVVAQLQPAAAALPATVAQARSLLARLNATFYWPDVDYFDKTRANWLTIQHLSRVATLVQAVTAPASSAFDDAALLAGVSGALDVWLTRHFTNPNWWYAWIGAELILQGVFVMLGENRTTPQQQAALVLASFDSAWWIDTWGGGTNLVDMIKVQLFRGLASANATAVAQGFAEMWADVAVRSPSGNGQGIQPDGSYHFHGELPMSWTYGADWVLDLLPLHGCAVGTAFDAPPPTLATLAGFLADGSALLDFGGCFDWTLAGRGVDRPGADFRVPFAPADLRALAARGPPQHARALAAWADRLAGAPGAPPLVGSKYFFNSDVLAHHRPTWGASLRMHGDNGAWAVPGGECDNGEDSLGEHQGDGVLNVYAPLAPTGTSVRDRFAGAAPLLDWALLPGTLTEYDTPLAPCVADGWPSELQRAFVGGVAGGGYAAAAMDTATHNTTARRAFFFFDDAVLALTSDIASTDARRAPRVRTAMAGRLVPPRAAVTVGFANGSTAELADGAEAWPAGVVAWLAAGGDGYVPGFGGGSGGSAPAAVGASVRNATAPWSRVGPYPGTASGRVLSAWIEHGAAPLAGAASSFLLLPGAAPADMPALAANGTGVTCVVNGGGVQAAAAPAARVLAAVFWAPGLAASCAGGAWTLTVGADAAALVLVTEAPAAAGGGVNVTVAVPDAHGGAVRVTVSRSVGGPGCAPGPAPGTTVVTVPTAADVDHMGESVTVSCAAAAAER